MDEQDVEQGSEVKYHNEWRVDQGIERITIQEGYRGLFDHGYFCLLERDGLCIEDFGGTRGAALRHARKAWNKLYDDNIQKVYGYPKVKECSE